MDISTRISAMWERLTATPVTIFALCFAIIGFTLLYYFMIRFLFKNNSASLVILFVAVMLIGAVVVVAISQMDSAVYLALPIVFIILMSMLYAVELKRIIYNKTHLKNEVKHGERASFDNEKIQNCISEIIKALQNMSKNDVGAIIILSTGNVPNQIVESGVRLESDISSELIESVFFPKTPLHDGAMIINDMKIEAAGCFLPLSQNLNNIPKGLGTRHRAGIGITETIDVVSIIVSEETGVISIVRAGKITRYADTEMLKKTLTKYYWQDQVSRR